MNSWLAAAAFVPGLFAGSIVVKAVIHWVALLLAAFGRDPSGSPKASATGRALPAVFTVLHPVPWLLLLGLPYGIHRLLQNPPAPGWLWFLGGILFAVLSIPVATLIMLRRIRARAGKATEPPTPKGNVA